MVVSFPLKTLRPERFPGQARDRSRRRALHLCLDAAAIAARLRWKKRELHRRAGPPCGYRCEPGSAQPVTLSRHRRQHTGAVVMDCGPGFAGAAAMPTASEAEGNGIAGPQDTDQAPRCRKLRTSPQSHRQSLQPLHARRMPQLLSRHSRRCTVSTTCFGFGSGPVLSCGSMAGNAAPPIAEGGAARQAPSAGAGR